MEATIPSEVRSFSDSALYRIKKLFETYSDSSYSYRCVLDGDADIQCPTLNPSSLLLQFFEGIHWSGCDLKWQNGQPLPFAASNLFEVELTSARRLTSSDAVKDTWELEFVRVPARDGSTTSLSSDTNREVKLSFSNAAYMPGDAFGFLCPNAAKEVDDLLELVKYGKERRDTPCVVRFLRPEKSAKQFGHFPQEPTTLKHLFSTCCDIRGVLKKTFLRALAEHTEDEEEKALLLWLSSCRGSQEYTNIILEQKMTILDLLTVFSTCSPPPELLLEYLPRLQPRFYSVSSWSEVAAKNCSFRVIYKQVVFPEQAYGVGAREGLCTSWLTKLALDWRERNKEGVERRLVQLSLNDAKHVIKIYLRRNVSFQFSRELDAKIIMVAHGSGLAPFLCYLQWKDQCLERQSLSDRETFLRIGETWLFFGCRYLDLDFLYREELERLLQRGVLSRLFVACSRGTQNGKGKDCAKSKYVQDSLRQHGQGVSKMITKEGCHVYVCGDAKGMSTDVRSAFCEVLCSNKVVASAEEAESYVKKMQKEGHYLQDVWA